eukprot:m.166882 g.166882  ORF g.166882 m.166882 type:complete len:634 (+) comp10342_c0_seq2:2291-4192(+)
MRLQCCAARPGAMLRQPAVGCYSKRMIRPLCGLQMQDADHRRALRPERPLSRQAVDRDGCRLAPHIEHSGLEETVSHLSGAACSHRMVPGRRGGGKYARSAVAAARKGRTLPVAKRTSRAMAEAATSDAATGAAAAVAAAAESSAGPTMTYKVVYKNRKYELTAALEEILLIPLEQQSAKAERIAMADIFTARVATTAKPGVQIWSLARTTRHSNIRRLTSHVALVESKEMAEELTGRLCNIATSGTFEGPVARRRILFLINPFSGRKKAPHLFEKEVLPILRLATHIDYKVIQTEYAGHAKEIAAGLDVSEHDAIATVSGDGLFHEIINGFMSRPDWEAAMQQIQVGAVPCGSGNGMSMSLGAPNITAAMLGIIKGNTVPLDLMSIRQPGQPAFFSHMVVMWGLFADIDIESEKYRWMGPVRFTFSGVARILNMRKYRGRLHYLPCGGDEAGEPTQPTADGPMDPFDPTMPGWQTISADFAVVVASLIPYQSLDVRATPYSRVGDGIMDVMVLTGDVPQAGVLAKFADAESGEAVHEPWCKYFKARSIIIEPLDGKGIMDVDGEVIPTVPTKCTVHPGVGHLLCVDPVVAPEFDPADVPREGLHLAGAAKPTHFDSVTAPNPFPRVTQKASV